jgi:hypothetical protein
VTLGCAPPSQQRYVAKAKAGRGGLTDAIGTLRRFGQTVLIDVESESIARQHRPHAGSEVGRRPAFRSRLDTDDILTNIMLESLGPATVIADLERQWTRIAGQRGQK